MAEVKYLDKTGLTSVWSKVKGIVTPKADKVSGATAGHLAGLNSSGNLMDSGLPASNIAQKDGSYSGMTVGAAEDLVSAESVASEFTSRITGGSTSVGKGGTALLDKIKGRTLVWNQLENGTWTSAFNLVKDGNTYTLSANAEIDTLTMSYNKSFITEHKYFVKAHLKLNREASLSGSFYPGYFATPTQWVSYGITGESLRAGFDLKEIITLATDKTTLYLGAYHVGTTDKFATTDTLVISNPQVYDLTLMFGAGNEPSTVAEFEALYPGPFYDYNAGELINNAAAGVETVGFNQWDEEWEVGSINDSDGQPETNSSYIRSKNFIPAFPSTEYYKTTNARVFFYDAGKNYLGYTPTNAAGTFTTPAGTRYLKIRINYASPYQNDICVGLSDPSRNGTYEPYWRSELELGLGDIKVKSHNIWDEEWELGSYGSNGEKSASNDRIRSANYIAVSPNTSYYFKLYASSSVICWYDSSYNFISRVSSSANDVRTSPANAAYCTFFCGAGYGNTYNNDLCINLSDTAFNGHYDPYGDGGVISITGGLKSAGTVYDEISGNKLVKRLESVGLSTLASWSAYDTANSRYNATVSDMRIEAARIAAALIPINNDYFTYQGRIYIETTNSDRTSFIASLAGVPLYYELAKPIEYELAEALPTAMRNDPYGTERRLPEDTAAIVTAPFRADITYSTNIKEAVQSLPQNYINVNSMQDFLAALGTLMGGTWTMRPADGKFDFTFTPNPSNE